jgi:hypothetical protein
MLNKYKKISALTIIMLIAISVFGQNTTSPFSMYGIGDISNSGFARNLSMGGLTSSLYSPYHLNPGNPATYSAIGQNSFIFEIGATAKYLKLNTPKTEFDDFNANFSYIAIGFPVTKWWKAGIGLLPLSNIGYTIQENIVMDYDGSELTNTYTGEGGITNFYFDNSFKILKSLSIGVKLSYSFGPLVYKRVSASVNESSSSYIIRKDKANISSFNYKTGIHFHRKLSDKLFLNLGATYGIESELKATDHLFIINSVTRSSGSSLVDTLKDEIIHEGFLELPQSYSVGASLLINKKLELGVDYSKADWSESKYFGEDQNLADMERFMFGAEFTPDYTAISYLKIIRYRLGANLSKSYMVYEGSQLQSYEITAGVGLPLKRTPSIVNFALSYQKRSIPGIENLYENYFSFQFNMSLHAIWFKKRKWE